MDKIPPPPQAVPVIGAGGRLTTPWNLWLTAFIKTLQDVGEGLDIQGLSGSGSGGVATSGAAPAVGLVLGPNAEGASNLGARADHVHQRSLGAEQDHIDGPSTIQSINILGPILESLVEPDLTSDVQALLFGYWPLTEASGTTRKMTYGSATTSDLVETGGTVATASGPYGLAVSCTGAAASHLGANGNIAPSLDISSGMTLTMWVWLDVVSPPKGSQLISLTTGGSYGILVERYAETVFVSWMYGSLAQVISTGNTTNTGAWHFLAAWYDPADKYAYAQLDGGAIVKSASALTALQEASITGLNSLWVTGNWRMGFDNWQGRVSALGVFPTVLTQAQRNRVMASRVSFVANPAAIELFGG